MANTLGFLRHQMIYCAYKANCLHDLKRDALLCGQVVRAEIYIGQYQLIEFPVSDVLGTEAFTELIDALQKQYTARFEYYRNEIRKLQAQNIVDNSGNVTDTA